MTTPVIPGVPPKPLDVSCPICGAPAGRTCRVSGKSVPVPHRARIRKARNGAIPPNELPPEEEGEGGL